MSAPTPGPWKYDRKWDGRILAGVPPMCLALITGGLDDGVELGPTSDANARLIAAAPDLLEALRAISDALVAYDSECQRVFGGHVQHAGRGSQQLMAVIRAIESSRTAIVKAEGSDEAHAVSTTSSHTAKADPDERIRRLICEELRVIVERGLTP